MVAVAVAEPDVSGSSCVSVVTSLAVLDVSDVVVVEPVVVHPAPKRENKARIESN